MKYSELISFKPIESTIQLLETADKKVAQDMVQTYVMSDTMADNLKATVIDQLQMEEVIDFCTQRKIAYHIKDKTITEE